MFEPLYAVWPKFPIVISFESKVQLGIVTSWEHLSVATICSTCNRCL